MFSPTVSESNKAPVWNTMVTFLRISRSCASVKVGDVLVGHKHAALIGLEEAHDVAQADGFAHAAAADDGYCFACVHVKVSVD